MESASSDQFEIVVNGQVVPVRDAKVTYAEVVDLAFPGGTGDANQMFKVDFEDAAGVPHAGSLVAGAHTEVKRTGTEFSVIRSVRS